MIKINNYISEIQKSIITYISSQQFNTQTSVITQFTKPNASIKKPVISMCFSKISLSQVVLNNYFCNTPNTESRQQNIDIDLSFLIYVPLKLGANICYDIFYDLYNILINNKIDISFSTICCDNIVFIKSINCFSLTVHAPINMIIR